MNINTKYYRWAREVTLILIVIFSVRFFVQGDIISGVTPNIRGVTLKGAPFDLYKNESRPILVHFWATWCPVCKLEQSSIDNIAKSHAVMTIAMQSGDDDELKAFMEEEKLSFNVINDQYGMLSHSYNIKGVPVSFIVNKENEIEFAEVGYTTELGLRLRLWWAGL